MEKVILRNPPILEAIFELRWRLKPLGPMKLDPNYKIAVGRLYDRINAQYPVYEPLSTADMPQEISGYVIQHRFRETKDGWPLIQFGPGIATLNDTKKYGSWEEFKARIPGLVDALFGAYGGDLHINALTLRYIDSVEFDFDTDDIFKFLSSNMKIQLKMDDNLFSETDIIRKPSVLDLKLSYPCQTPAGVIHLRFARGSVNDTDALIWETVIQSEQGRIPQAKDEIADVWAKDAHALAHTWFFNTIEGALRRRFEHA
jgi:uncharacterized protein (TIGR04255 family)